MQLNVVANNRRGLHALLNLNRLTEVVDVGANPIDGDPPYKTMLQEGMCRLTGFEPQMSALELLEARKGGNEIYLPYAVGDGEEHTLRICNWSGLTSLFELDVASLEIFPQYLRGGELRGQEQIQTRRLDDIEEIGRMDFLKIDIQGGELSVFRNGRRTLANAVAIQTEVSFVPLYKEQPCIGDIDLELRSQGFIPHCLATPAKTAPIAPVKFGDSQWTGLNQLLEADLVYVRDFRKPHDLSSDMLKHLALIATCCYRSIDLTRRCLKVLADRGDVDRDAGERFMRAEPASV